MLFSVDRVGDRFTLMTNPIDPPSLVLTKNVEFPVQHIREMTLCFWVYINSTEQNKLGTVLSYGTNGKTTLVRRRVVGRSMQVIRLLLDRNPYPANVDKFP